LGLAAGGKPFNGRVRSQAQGTSATTSALQASSPAGPMRPAIRFSGAAVPRMVFSSITSMSAAAALMASTLWCALQAIFLHPAPFRESAAQCSKGLPFSVQAGFGSARDRGPILVPSPAAKTNASRVSVTVNSLYRFPP